jgi:hypothetical protein
MCAYPRCVKLLSELSWKAHQLELRGNPLVKNGAEFLGRAIREQVVVCLVQVNGDENQVIPATSASASRHTVMRVLGEARGRFGFRSALLLRTQLLLAESLPTPRHRRASLVPPCSSRIE